MSQTGQPGQMGQNNQQYMHNNMASPGQIPPPTPELVQQSFTANQGTNHHFLPNFSPELGVQQYAP